MQIFFCIITEKCVSANIDQEFSAERNNSAESYQRSIKLPDYRFTCTFLSGIRI